MKKEIITGNFLKSPVSESFRALRTNLQYMNYNKKTKVILFTSTTQGEGKSWIAANLAVTFTQSGKNVLIIDSDMRRPRQHRIFNADMYPGLSNYLSGISSTGRSKDILARNCIRKTEVEGLYLLPSGSIPPNPSELIATDKTAKMIEEFREIFDIIIFDGAPCLLVTDSTVLSRMVDSTIIVCAAGITKRDDLREAKNRITTVGGTIGGVILNKVKVSNKKYDNKYYYANNETLENNPRHRKGSRENNTNTADECLPEIEKLLQMSKKPNRRISKIVKEEKNSKTNKTEKIIEEIDNF